MSRILLTFFLSPLLGGCVMSYRLEEGPGFLELRTGWPVIGLEIGAIAVLLVLVIFYRRILERITREEQSAITVGRIAMFLIAGFIALNFLWPHWVWRIRVDENGVTRKHATTSTFIPWDEMVRVRNHYTRQVATPNGLLKSPRLEIVGSYEETIYIKELDVGIPIYDALVNEIGSRYYQREQLIDGPPDPQRRKEVVDERNRDKDELLERAKDLLMTHKPDTIPMTEEAVKQ